jgi:hypothetical protein
MRRALLIAAGIATAAGLSATATPAAAVCSVFDKHPCLPTVCSVFQRRPCIPEIEYPIGQDLRLTIESKEAQTVSASPEEPYLAGKAADDHAEQEHKLNTIRDMFAALRGCWVPPPPDQARHGMQMTVRFSFKRSGEIIATPRVTYASPEATRELRDTYLEAITAALGRCTPMPFTTGMGGAIAGRPIAIRFVDNRTLEAKDQQ